MSMMDSDLKKQAEKAALIGLAVPFLKIPQAICIDGADNDDADDNTADNDTDNNADVNADNNIATQTMDDAAADNDDVMQMTDNDADNDAATQMTTPQTQTTTPLSTYCSVVCLSLLPMPTVQLSTLSLPAPAPFCCPLPAAVILLWAPAVACLCRSYQWLVVASLVPLPWPPP